MTKKPRLTAEEFAEQLRHDADYQALLRQRGERAEQIREHERALIDDLTAIGYASESINDLLHRYAPLPGKLVQYLVDSLPQLESPALQESVVRALGAAGESFRSSVLITLFESTNRESLRWAIANTFAELRPLDARRWLISALQEHSYGKAREMLTLAVARTSPPLEANPVLVRLLQEMPGHAAMGLAESGTVQELAALKERLGSARGWVARELRRAIKAINQRA